MTYKVAFKNDLYGAKLIVREITSEAVARKCAYWLADQKVVLEVYLSGPDGREHIMKNPIL